jgi:hypothetical protein
VVYYRPGMEKIAQAFNDKYIQAPKLEPRPNLPHRVDIKVILGHDFAHRQGFITKLAKRSEPASAPDQAGPKPESAPVALDKIVAKSKTAEPTNSPPETQPTVKATAELKPPSPPETAAPAKSKTGPLSPRPSAPPILAAPELSKAGIELRNGSGTAHMVRDTWRWLARKGLRVVAAGNYKNYRQEQTVVYYRPGMEKIAQALNKKFFQAPKLEPRPNLPQKVDIKVILGHDFAHRQGSTTKLSKLAD